MNPELHSYIWCICWIICGYAGYGLLLVMEQRSRINGRALFSAPSNSYFEDALKHFVICVAGPAWIGVYILVSIIFFIDSITTKKRPCKCHSKNGVTDS